jgi:putative ABC transport system permease protein
MSMSLWEDCRYAVRLLLRSPGYVAATVVVLGLAIGANSAIFSIVDAALLRPLPFHQPDRIVSLWEDPPSHRPNRVSPLNFQDWHDRNTAFTHLAAYAGDSKTLQTRDGSERLAGQAVTLEFFDVLGIHPIAGRLFTADDERRHADVVLLGESVWRNRFGADPRLIGGALTLDGKPYTVAGVLPAGFQFAWPADVWSLYTVKRDPDQRRMHYLGVIGRLRPDLTIPQAEDAMRPVARDIAAIAPDTNRGWGIVVEPLRDVIVGKELRDSSLALAGVVGLVLLMAAANIAGLTLTRANGRSRELAVRAALGASALRLARQLLTESLLVAGLGGAAGLGIAAVLIRLAPSVLPPGALPVGVPLQLDARVGLFAFLITAGAGLLFGMAPAWLASRATIAPALSAGTRLAGARSPRLLAGIAAAEIAVGVVVLAIAGLFLRTLDHLQRVDTGFHATNVVTMHVTLPVNRYPAPDRALAFYDDALRRIQSLPGVRSAAFGGSLPLMGWNIGQGFEVIGEPPIDATHRRSAHYQIVGPRYFETLGIPLRTGRPFADSDRAAAQPVAIVNEEFVRRYLNGKPAIGHHVRVQSMNMRGPGWVDREIVAVAGQVAVDGPMEKEKAVEIYVPLAQNPWFDASLAVRADGDPLSLVSSIRAAVAQADPQLAVSGIRTMEDLAYRSVARPRFRAELLGSFALLALALAAVGVFGVLAFSVAQQTREFGVRIALGARASDVLSQVLARGLWIAGAGICLGLGIAAAVTRSLGSLLFGVAPLDGATLAISAIVLAGVALAASAIPAVRAARVDPAVTLRQDG